MVPKAKERRKKDRVDKRNSKDLRQFLVVLFPMPFRQFVFTRLIGFHLSKNVPAMKRSCKVRTVALC